MDEDDQPLPPDSSPLAKMASRAYQIEMFEQSMKENIIVTMDTGSGKTQIARLRIEAELERTPSKLTWFAAPSVVLARHQHVFLSSQLPAYGCRLIVGEDNPSYWSGQPVWDKALEGVSVVVSTPQVLLEALSNGFVKLTSISLLIFDEAHHCIGQSPFAQIMQLHYHPLKQVRGDGAVPCMLGLTATAVTNSARQLQELESNMNASCRRPTRHLEEYEAYVHVPRLRRLQYSSQTLPSSELLKRLRSRVAALAIDDDPRTKWLQDQGTPHAHGKLEKIYRLGYTPVMKEMRSFLGHVEEIESAVGVWAAATYVQACISNLHDLIKEREPIFMDFSEDEQQYIYRKLHDITSIIDSPDQLASQSTSIARKGQVLIDYLLRKCTSQLTVIIFVKRRSVAWTLARLLQSHSTLGSFGVFCFIGAASFRKRSLVDLVDVKAQNAAFADFQGGKRHICVATPVMEEGIDVQAVNMVVRFDQPENLRSYIQARGRARQADSRLVIIDDESTPEKVAKWEAIEREMKACFEDEQRVIAEWKRMESVDESCSEEYRVPTTNAVLTYNNARQRLDHFCSTLPRSARHQPAEPIIRISGVVGEKMSARIQLPSSVPRLLQITDSLRLWRSAKAATKEAAFHCYRRLHMAGAVNDHLVPFPPATSHEDSPQTRASMCSVRQAVDPWQHKISHTTNLSHLNAYGIEVCGTAKSFPSLVCLMPAIVDYVPPFMLWNTPFGDLSVKVSSIRPSLDVDVAMAIQTNKLLFELILGRRLKDQSLDDDLPFLLLPAEHTADLPSWLQRTRKGAVPLTNSTFSSSLESQTYLLRCEQDHNLYLWVPESANRGVLPMSAETIIKARRLTRQLHFLNAESSTSSPVERELLVGDCYLEQLPAAYGEMMLFVPSISHMLGLAIRAQIALDQSPLRKIGFKKRLHIQEALTTAAASSTSNYDRLEFLGDAALKFYTSIQVFFQDINLPESVLTAKRGALTSNARLQKVARNLGLDSYITVDPFSGHDWKLRSIVERPATRELSSKTLADVTEALIGAVLLDAVDGDDVHTRAISALSTFLPEVRWRRPQDHINDFLCQGQEHLLNAKRLTIVEDMIGRRFEHKALLGEALTKNSLRPGVPSYERLEFLGDAILDRIVSAKLHQSLPSSDSESLTARHHALVNHRFLTFLSLSMFREVHENEIICPGQGQEVITRKVKIVRLVDHMDNIPDKAQIAQRKRAEQTFLESCADIQTALTSSRSFPWTLLHSIDSSKMYSDVIESLLGAIYIDSRGDLEACTTFLDKIGLMQVLSRLAVEGGEQVEPLPSLSLLHIRQPSVKIERKALGQISKDTKRWKCTLSLGEETLAVRDSQISQSHADCLAAEAAHEVLDTKSD